MFGLKDLVNFASASGDGKNDIFTPQVSTHTCAKFSSRSQEFYKKWREIWLGKILANTMYVCIYTNIHTYTRILKKLKFKKLSRD